MNFCILLKKNIWHTNRMKLPSRNIKNYKGQNGIVLVIGGNEQFYGAPVLAALGVEKSGVDLIFLSLPQEHMNAAKQASLNFILHPFHISHFSLTDIDIVSILRPHSRRSSHRKWSWKKF